jgi:GT2 family glycosyltransferase
MQCIDSIDYKDVEVIIVLNGSPEVFVGWLIKRLSRSKKVHILELPTANLALALEYGTQKARHNLLLYMDSDCRFEQGAIRAFVDIANKYDPRENVFKGAVIFERGNTRLSRIISESRAHHTAEVLTAYKPPLLVSKGILPAIGGYAFNEKLIWREDSDLDNRIKRAGIRVLHVPKGIIHHRPISLQTDLRSTFRYGMGLAIANVLQIELTEVPRSTASAFRSKGLAVALYMLFSNRIYGMGYLYARIRLLSEAYLDGKINR